MSSISLTSWLASRITGCDTPLKYDVLHDSHSSLDLTPSCETSSIFLSFDWLCGLYHVTQAVADRHKLGDVTNFYRLFSDRKREPNGPCEMLRNWSLLIMSLWESGLVIWNDYRRHLPLATITLIHKHHHWYLWVFANRCREFVIDIRFCECPVIIYDTFLFYYYHITILIDWFRMIRCYAEKYVK